MGCLITCASQKEADYLNSLCNKSILFTDTHTHTLSEKAKPHIVKLGWGMLLHINLNYNTCTEAIITMRLTWSNQFLLRQQRKGLNSWNKVSLAQLHRGSGPMQAMTPRPSGSTTTCKPQHKWQICPVNLQVVYPFWIIQIWVTSKVSLLVELGPLEKFYHGSEVWIILLSMWYDYVCG